MKLAADGNPDLQAHDPEIVRDGLSAQDGMDRECVALCTTGDQSLLVECEHQWRKEPLLLVVLGVDEAPELCGGRCEGPQRAFDQIEHLDLTLEALDEQVAELAASDQPYFCLRAAKTSPQGGLVD